MLLLLREIINVCESKEKQERFLFSCETYTRIIVIDLINSELIWSLSRGFSLQREKSFPRKFCALVCDCYFGLLILLLVLFGTQH